MAQQDGLDFQSNNFLQNLSIPALVYKSSDRQIVASNSMLWDLFACKSEDEFMSFCDGKYINLIMRKEQE